MALFGWVWFCSAIDLTRKGGAVKAALRGLWAQWQATATLRGWPALGACPLVSPAALWNICATYLGEISGPAHADRSAP